MRTLRFVLLGALSAPFFVALIVGMAIAGGALLAISKLADLLLPAEAEWSA